MIPPPPRSTHFPYTTLFRSPGRESEVGRIVEGVLVQAGLQLVERIVVRHVGRERHFGERLFLVGDRKSTRLNSSQTVISYAVFCLKKKKQKVKSSTPQPRGS